MPHPTPISPRTVARIRRHVTAALRAAQPARRIIQARDPHGASRATRALRNLLEDLTEAAESTADLTSFRPVR